eukprot:XP_001709927.1 Hypothetical protein GL50803_29555 [Giardia lamblia ATCC 50803]
MSFDGHQSGKDNCRDAENNRRQFSSKFLDYWERQKGSNECSNKECSTESRCNTCR